jgi:hypothetical protein
MFLVIGFRPGDSLSIAGRHFAVDVILRSLTDDHGATLPLSDMLISPVAGVHVRVADLQRWPGMLSLAFEAPRDVLLLRHSAAAGGVQ